MMVYRLLLLLSLPTLTYLLAPVVVPTDVKKYSIKLIVFNSFTKTNMTYTTEIAYRGILLGAMRNLQKTKTFNFTVTEDINYGPYLESVNGVAANTTQHTYWELLAQLQNGTIIRPDVGVGCYIPRPYDVVILKFTNW